MSKMNPEIKEKWVKALRSGDFTQTTGVLKRKVAQADGTTQDQHCCLGVLCEMVGANFRLISPDIQTYDLDGMVGELTPEIRSETQLSASEQKHLIGMNDEGGKNFNEIADYIEENL